MKNLFISWFFAGLILWLTSEILGPGVMEFSGVWPVIWTAAVVGILNALLAPLLNLLTCPFYLLTLGLSRFLVNGIVLLISSNWVAGFEIKGFWWAVLAAIIIAILTSIIDNFTGRSSTEN